MRNRENYTEDQRNKVLVLWGEKSTRKTNS